MFVDSFSGVFSDLTDAMEVRLKRVGAMTQPCFTPLVTANGWDASLLACTLACMPSWNCRMLKTNFRASILGHDLPQAVSADSVKRFGKIDIGGVQVGILFLALLLELSGSEHHVDCSPFFTKPTLAFRQEALFFQVCDQSLKELGEIFPCYGQKGDAAGFTVSFLLVKMYDGSIFEVL